MKELHAKKHTCLKQRNEKAEKEMQYAKFRIFQLRFFNP